MGWTWARTPWARFLRRLRASSSGMGTGIVARADGGPPEGGDKGHIMSDGEWAGGGPGRYLRGAC